MLHAPSTGLSPIASPGQRRVQRQAACGPALAASPQQQRPPVRARAPAPPPGPRRPRARAATLAAAAASGAGDPEPARPRGGGGATGAGPAGAGPSSEALPAALNERLSRLRALEEFRALLEATDILCPATAVAPGLAAPPPPLAPPSPPGDRAGGPAGARRPRPPLDLLRAALLIARHAQPQLDFSVCERELARLAAAAEARLPPGAPRYPLRLVRVVNAVLYSEAGFKGDAEDYYNPDNSCIDRVLQRRRGIPISLSLIYMAVAARVGLRMEPVNLPAHLMLRPVVAPGPRRGAGRDAAPEGEGEGDGDSPGLLVDAFNGGELCWLADAEERLSAITGMQVVLDPRWTSRATPAMSGGQFLLRWLNNLRQVYILSAQADNALSILRYMRATLETMQQQAEEKEQQQSGRTPSASSPAGGPFGKGGVPAALGPLTDLTRDEGLCLYALGRWAEAAEALASYLAAVPSAHDALMVRSVLEKVRAAQRRAAAGGNGGDGGGGGGGAP
ncbi:hypothetical protein Rsub_11888 [Raphidocelis subcapitata]|uniref:Protein SirB1 N-terminal domain-containing protein n=1 Tax=Raphidocelis subcapitata TaxID=307507 RepID=A0A2V0PFD3_9CHLO|nr:hypothetical protein Rsub_11888 [Raphidocelis subcapitata]|eukprot:GBF98558.1 hypothetical protein Rsub_11888 [Raphidocelis subcapitata]